MMAIELRAFTDPGHPKCGAQRGPHSLILCELPPDHIVGRNTTPYREHFHTGRNRTGRWYRWAPVES